MTTNQLRILSSGLFFLIVFLSGYGLSHFGKPYSVLLLTVHKLISVAAVVFLVVIMARINRAAPLGSLELIAAVITGLLFLGTIATGGLLSTAKPMPAIVHHLHQITPFLTLVSTALTLYLLLSRK